MNNRESDETDSKPPAKRPRGNEREDSKETEQRNAVPPIRGANVDPTLGASDSLSSELIRSILLQQYPSLSSLQQPPAPAPAPVPSQPAPDDVSLLLQTLLSNMQQTNSWGSQQPVALVAAPS